ncbi:MAG: UvrB/UvrC motif-containing protein [Candidatus Eisenbacteria sp.]|nr:UvrB/UvrC motif-containing protein [Candidatus Eisenbacteria bacterium]
MKCQNCHVAEATVHVKEVKNDKVTELHLCEKCAREKGFHSMMEIGKLSIASQMVWMAENLYPEGSHRVGQVQCTECGLKYSEFLKTGRLGCPSCYGAFGAQLKQVMRRIHGSVRHVGKAPGKNGAQFERRRQIQKLHEDLELAIEREEYEKAAVIRDEIRKVESTAADAAASDQSATATATSAEVADDSEHRAGPRRQS